MYILLIITILFCIYLISGNIFVNKAIKKGNDTKDILNKNKDEDLPDVKRKEDSFIKDMEKDIQEVSIKSTLDNIDIYYYILKNNKTISNNYITLIHGFSGSHYSTSYFAKIFYDLGYNIITMDLRGHGKSKANYIGMGILDSKDLLDVLKDFTEKNKECNIALFGVSMGAATVLTSLNLDLPKQVKCVIEDSGYTSVKDEFKYQLKNIFKLPSFLVYSGSIISKIKANYSFLDKSSIDGVMKNTLPLLVIHGKKDKFVPQDMGIKIYMNSKSKNKECLFLDNAGHVRSIYVDKDTYVYKVKEFLKKYL